MNRGNRSFERARKSQIYVDKTGLLGYTNEVLDTEQCYICNSRPRRFGKSMAAGMLAAYYGRGCDSRELFEGLEISGKSSFEKHLNQYDVIHLDIAYLLVQKKSAVETVSFMQKCVIDELKDIYPGLLSEEESELPLALSAIHHANGARFVIIIDEWDAIFRENMSDEAGQQAYIRLLRGLFKGEQSKDFVLLAYITGILPIKKYKSESALNNFREFTMISPKQFSEYMGFNEQEVRALCQTHHMDFSETARCLVDTNTFQNDMTSFRSRDDVLTVLIHLGYLAYDAQTREAYVPNEEVRMAFAKAIKDTDWTPVVQAIRDSDNLLKATWNKDADAVAVGIDKVYMENTSILQYNNENALSCVIEEWKKE